MNDRRYRLSGIIEGSSDADLVGKTYAAGVEIEWQPHGVVGFPVPAGWELFVESGMDSLQRADRARSLLPTLLVPMRSPNPNPVRGWGTNGDQLHAFFRYAASGIVLCYTGLSNWSSDMIPSDLVVEIKGKRHARAGLVDMGLEWRLTKVAAAWSGRANLKQTDPTLLDRVLQLKMLRDDLEHVPHQTIYLGGSADGSIYARLLRHSSLRSLGEAVEAVIGHYSR